MQAVHELGHVIGAWATGAEVKRVVLTPSTISRTDVVNNLHPLVVVWAGPMVGAALPILLWLLARLHAYQCICSPIFCRLLSDCEWSLHWTRIFRWCGRLRRNAPVWRFTVAALVVRGSHRSNWPRALAPARRALWAERVARSGIPPGRVHHIRCVPGSARNRICS